MGWFCGLMEKDGWARIHRSIERIILGFEARTGCIGTNTLVIQTNIGNLNREIKAANRLMKSIRQLIQNLKGWITELGEERKELLAQKTAEEATLLPNLLMKYMEIRKEERRDWTRAGQNRGTSQDLKTKRLSFWRIHKKPL